MSVIEELSGSKFDFPEYQGAPSCELMVAALPRSGSTAFCSALWETGRLGSPMEYLNFELIAKFPRWANLLQNPTRYWATVQQYRTSPNGVFSFKMFPQNYKSILSLSSDLLEQIRPTHVVYLTRRDLDRQAISYSRAMQSSAWFEDAAEFRCAVYNPKHISTCKKLLIRQMQEWEHIFAITETNVLRVTYEEFIENKDCAINAVCEFLGEECIGTSIQLPQTRIQRDEETEVWVKQYQDSSDYVPNILPLVRNDELIFDNQSILSPTIEVRDSFSPRGRGVYARCDFQTGDLVECAPVIIIQDSLLPELLKRYVFNWPELATGTAQRAIALGYGSLYNHAASPNLSYSLDLPQRGIRFIAKAEIRCGSELTINYNTGDGIQGDLPDNLFKSL